MKTFALAALALLVLPASPADDVSTRAAEGQRVQVLSRTETTMRFGAMAITFDGEEMPADDQETPPDQVTTEALEFVDEVLAAEDGRRTRVRRSFETIEREEEDGDGSEEATGVLEGRTVLLARGEDDEVEATLADDGEDVDAKFLEGFDLTYDEELLLPDGPVEEGDSWTVEGDRARRYFGLEGGVEWYDDADEGEDAGPDFEELFADELSGEVEVTYEGAQDYDGEEVWAFSFELSMQGALDGLSASDLGMGDGEENPFASGEAALEADMTGTGRFWVLRESRRLLASEGQGDVEMQLTLSSQMAAHELVAEITFEIRIENETRYSAE